MYAIFKTKSFLKSYQKLQSAKINKKVFQEIETIVLKLAHRELLDSKYKDHQLKGQLQKYRECHIRPDVLLLYKVNDNDLILILLYMVHIRIYLNNL